MTSSKDIRGTNHWLGKQSDPKCLESTVVYLFDPQGKPNQHTVISKCKFSSTTSPVLLTIQHETPLYIFAQNQHKCD